jgi:hypothetical protein
VSPGRRATAFGLLIALVYLVAAAVSARIDPFAARPILDGIAGPPLYRWVEPPPPFVSTNKAPESGRFELSPADVTYDPGTGSEAGVFATGDFQANLALATHAIAPRPGATSVSLTLTPIAPGADLRLPDGYRIAGNVVRIDAVYRPAGGRVSRLARPSLLTLSYPIVVQGGFSNAVLVSTDATRWTALKSTDHPGQQAVIATVRSLGYVAVGQTSGTETPVPTTPPARAIDRWVVVALVVAAIVAVVLVIVLRRRDPESPRRPPPPDDRDAFDPWKV